MTNADVLSLIRNRIGENTKSAWASKMGISSAYLSDILAGRRELGPKLLTALGLEREIVYRKKRA